MDEDPIRVLYFRNPHLIWVEVRKHGTLSLKQVGLFGVVPRQASMLDGQRVCSKSDKWDLRVNDIVEEFLETKHQLSFISTYRLDEDEERSSILHDQPHIFGEISVRKPDGSKKLLSTCLDNSVYALKSKKEFWQMLNTQKIETVLKEDEQIKVLRNIVQFYKDDGTWNQKKDIFYQHITPQQVIQLKGETTSKLTVENLEKHMLLTEQKSNDTYIIQKPKIYKPYIKKYKDFNSVSKPELAPVEFVENVIKNMIKPNGDVKSPKLDNSFEDTTQKHTGSMKKELKNKENIVENKPVIKTSGDINGRGMVSHMTVYDEELLDEPKEDKGVKFRGRASNRAQDKKTDPVFESPGSNTKSEEIVVAYGPPIENLHKLTKKKVSRKSILPDAPSVDILKEPKNDDNCSIRYDSIDRNYQSSKTVNMDKNKHNNVKLDDLNDNVRNNLKTNINVKDVADNVNLNYSKIYNDSIPSKQEKKGMKELLELHSSDSNNIEQNKQTTVDNNDSAKKTIQTNSKHSEPVEIKGKSPQKTSRMKLLELLRKRQEVAKLNNSSSSSNENDYRKMSRSPKHEIRDVKSDNTKTDSSSLKTISKDSDLEELEEIRKKLNSFHEQPEVKTKTKIIPTETAETHANPYKNLEAGKSVFVENLIQPLILAHSKYNRIILPQSSLRDIPFKVEVHNTLRNMQIKDPNRLQSVSWPYILRGHSMILISAANSGKTLGYVPPVCNLILDYNFDFAGQGPICIIVCATALSVSDVAKQCRMFLNYQRVITCYSGIDNTKFAIDILNGCDVLVTTPSMLYKWLSMEIGIDLRRLTTLVFEDCERLSSVYELELKAVQIHVKLMLKSRTDKQVRVQYILASRQWCDFMTSLAKKAPDTIVAFAAFHECVLYAKVNTSVSVVKKEKKANVVVEFLQENYDADKLTVIICRSDDEVELLQKTLTDLKYTVTACNNQMDIHELYKLRTEVFTSILICCDGNLSHLNVTYANYLVHYSMPAVFSRFCRRFAVLNDNYPSIFAPENANVKIKILLEESNVEELPKILNFVKRCSSQVPDVLDKVASQVLEQKDFAKAEKLVPICDNLLSLGECADLLACQERHAILGAFDEPKPWMPVNGTITFKIVHYSSPIAYSARLLSHSTKNDQKKYPETYSALCMKLGMFFSKQENKRLHREPQLGDICAVAVRTNFIARCQVLKVVNYEKGMAKNVIINIIDEEFITVVRAVELFYLPEEFKSVVTYVAKVKLAGIRPQDKDVTFSELALNSLKSITDEDEQLYLRGKIVMAVGNTIFVDTLEACADLSALCRTVVKYDFKMLLLKTHAIANPEHLTKLTEICHKGQFKIERDHKIVNNAEVVRIMDKPVNKEPEHSWAHFDKNDWTEVIFTNTINAGTFFVRLQKFVKCMDSLIADIKMFVNDKPEPVVDVNVEDVVLAEFPDDGVYERAIIEEIIDSAKVKCFFVDNADWRDVAVTKLKKIPRKFIKQLPFQSIECRLVGINPPGENWTEFSTNWLYDNCLEDVTGKPKIMFLKYFVKEKAQVTGGHKYGVILVDTSSDNDLVINKMMLQLNLASVREDEICFLDKPLDFVRENTDTSSCNDDFENLHKSELSDKESFSIPRTLTVERDSDWADVDNNIDLSKEVVPYVSPLTENVPKSKNMPGKLIRSVPLLSDSDEDLDKWDVCMDDTVFSIPQLTNIFNNDKVDETNEFSVGKLENTPNKSTLPATANSTPKNNALILKTDHFQNNADVVLNKIDISKSKVNKADLVRITDVSLDSDDTTLILTELNKLNSSKTEFSVLDSDDSQTRITETNKETKETSQVDSDDSDSIVAISKTPSNIDLDISTRLGIPNSSTCKKATQLKTIPITEIKTSLNATMLNDEEKNKGQPEIKLNENSEILANKKLIEKDYTNSEIEGKTVLVTASAEPIRTPQLIWRQNNDQIIIKIKLVVDNYELDIQNRSIKFSACQNETKYAFDIELYGPIQNEMTKHSNKGQYILINLYLMINKVKWLKLASGPAKSWIVYDVDAIDTSSDEESSRNEDTLKLILDNHEKGLEVDDDDDDMDDTRCFRYKNDKFYM